jgi:hypothetical protein
MLDGDCAVVVDFKTDAAPGRSAREDYPHYVAQVEAYVRVVVAGGLSGVNRARGALLWTHTGALEWI